MSRDLGNHTLRRIKQGDRIRAIRPRTIAAHAHDDALAERKRMEKLWEQSINFFEGEVEGGSDDGKA